MAGIGGIPGHCSTTAQDAFRSSRRACRPIRRRSRRDAGVRVGRCAGAAAVGGRLRGAERGREPLRFSSPREAIERAYRTQDAPALSSASAQLEPRPLPTEWWPSRTSASEVPRCAATGSWLVMSATGGVSRLPRNGDLVCSQRRRRDTLRARARAHAASSWFAGTGRRSAQAGLLVEPGALPATEMRAASHLWRHADARDHRVRPRRSRLDREGRRLRGLGAHEPSRVARQQRAAVTRRSI